MIIDGRLPEGYVVVCTCDRGGHSFLVRRLGPSVECPNCGYTAISADLATAFLCKQAGDRAAALTADASR